ncbi:hypothetical protein [Providencia sp. PROV132]|uniref:hypothetical protein n=1 Tax=Providencia sp. PROV132 TaxID=2949842 RepID=UPI003FA69EA7
MHTPFIANTEVTITFDDGDLDKPYIAFHDLEYPDHVNRYVPPHTHKLEAPMSAMAIREQNRARAKLEFALAGPMWGISAGAAVIVLVPSTPVVIGEVATTTASVNAIKLGGNVVDFVVFHTLNCTSKLITS